MNNNVVIYPGTFDPITFGHVDLIQRALRLFDRLIIAIAENGAKAPLFSLEERIRLVRQVLQNNHQIEVIGFDGLLVDLAKKKGANIILRGLRVVSDFDYEFRIANTNRVLSPEIETIFLIPSERYSYVSSSLVREVASFKGNVSKFVPAIVEEALRDKFKSMRY